jgi:hypothetical protein
VGAARTALGLAAMACPQLPATPWVGAPAASGTAGRVLGRAMGGRDVALGAGAVHAAMSSASSSVLAAWVAAGALADTVDVLSTAACWRNLPTRGRLAVALLASGGAITGIVVATALSASAFKRPRPPEPWHGSVGPGVGLANNAAGSQDATPSAGGDDRAKG